MNRHQRRAANASSRFRACTSENLAKAAVMADQAGQPGMAELMRQVGRGGLALIFASNRDQAITVPDLKQARGPTLAVIGDDDHRSTGPSGWRAAKAVAGWTAAAVVHAAGATAESYAEAARAARLLGRAVLIETDTAHAEEWGAIFVGRPVLFVLPRSGPHPILPSAGRMH